MKNIQNYEAPKYNESKGAEPQYRKIDEGIYECREEDEILYVSSLSFEQEEEYEEGGSAADISQYPLEDILDRFYCHISDFYEELNHESSAVCYLEFASGCEEDVRNLRSIIGKHVYNQEYEENGQIYVRLVIE